MSDDSNAPADLSTIGIDLSQIFRPSWTVESTDSTAHLAAKFDEGDRFERQGGNRRPEGRAQGRDRAQNRGPSRDRDSNSRDRAPRPQSTGQGAKSQQGTAGGQSGPSSSGAQRSERGPVRDSRDRRPENRGREERHPEPAPKPILEGWSLALIPEHSALEAIAKQIRSRAKAYPLFELARLIVNLSDRYKITLKAESENSPKLFQVKSDGSLWTSRKGAVAQLLSRHLEKFYRRSSVTLEAPKGSYSVVAQCGMSGVLLGPPNHHEYQSRLLALHSSRFKNLPFEVYKTRIKMMRDDALMEQWKTEQSTRTVFIPIDPVVETTSVPTELSEQIPVATEAAETTAKDIPEETLAPESVEPTEVGAATEESVSETESAEIPAQCASDGPQLSLEEATEHFHKNHAENEVVIIDSEITLPGRIALHESDPLLHELLIKTLQELDRFPLSLAQVIGKELSGSGLQIYKAHKKIIHVSVARPRYLDRATTPTSEGFRGILDYLEAHPKQPRDKQWAGMLALRSEPAGDDAEAIQRREQSLGTDLLWLLHQGHVIDFAMGNLQAALRPVPQQKQGQPSAAQTTSAAKETPESQPSEESAAPEIIAEESVMEETFPEAVSETAESHIERIESATEAMPEITPEPSIVIEQAADAPIESTESAPQLHS